MSSISISEFSLVVLIGGSDAERADFATRNFQPDEVLNFNRFVEWIGAGKTGQEIEMDADEAMSIILEKRLKHKLLTVIDANNLNQLVRKPFRLLSRKYHAVLTAVVFGFGTNGKRALEESKILEAEGFSKPIILQTVTEAEAAEVLRIKPNCDRRFEKGPFDVVGDLHGCLTELKLLLEELGYSEEEGKWHPHCS